MLTEIASFFFMLGAMVVDTLEGWTLALFVLVIIFDTYVGLRNRYVLIFNALQIIGLVLGYLWANSVFQRQDVAGPYAWAIVVGIWFKNVLVFHSLYLLDRLRARGARS